MSKEGTFMIGASYNRLLTMALARDLSLSGPMVWACKRIIHCCISGEVDNDTRMAMKKRVERYLSKPQFLAAEFEIIFGSKDTQPSKIVIENVRALRNLYDALNKKPGFRRD